MSSDADSSGEVPREQLETALEYLEYSHGMYMDLPRPEKVEAYYDAIGMLEAAMEEELKPVGEVHRDEYVKKHIERSRQARKEGPEAARISHVPKRSSYDRPPVDPEPIHEALWLELKEVVARVRRLF